MTPSPYTLFVGVDIAAASASVSWQTLDTVPCPPLEIAQTKSGWRELQKQLRATGHLPEHTLVVVEATGSYWMQEGKVIRGNQVYKSPQFLSSVG
jgi:hypothetical protein